jgi:hypothetical protein
MTRTNHVSVCSLYFYPTRVFCKSICIAFVGTLLTLISRLDSSLLVTFCQSRITHMPQVLSTHDLSPHRSCERDLGGDGCDARRHASALLHNACMCLVFDDLPHVGSTRHLRHRCE